MIRIAILVISLVSYTKSLQLSTCENDSVNLNCDSNQILDIVSANYGRLDTATCANGVPASQVANTTCRSSSSTGVVQGNCENKNNCSLVAQSVTFGGDPCPGIKKYLSITYNCVNKITSEVCCPGLISLSCPSGKRIQILDVFWGRRQTLTCAFLGILGNNARCDASSVALTNINNNCGGQNSCTILTTLLPTGDCGLGLISRPYLSVTHICVT